MRYQQLPKAMQLLEGACPDCPADPETGFPVGVEIVKISGTQDFIDTYGYDDGEYTLWDEAVTEDGEIQFLCPNGHKNSVFHLPCGDFVCS